MHDNQCFNRHELRESLRRTSSGAVRVAAEELDRFAKRQPDAQLDPGREWAVAWLKRLATQLRDNPIEDNEDYK